MLSLSKRLYLVTLRCTVSSGKPSGLKGFQFVILCSLCRADLEHLIYASGTVCIFVYLYVIVLIYFIF